MYRVSFRHSEEEIKKWNLQCPIGHKGGFATAQEADDWACEQAEAGRQPLKLLKWDESVESYKTIKKY